MKIDWKVVDSLVLHSLDTGNEDDADVRLSIECMKKQTTNTGLVCVSVCVI